MLSIDGETAKPASHAVRRSIQSRSLWFAKPARLLNAMNHHPPAARLMALLAVGIFGVAAAVIVAKNELQRSSKVPALKVFNSQVADERYRMTKERAELLRRMIVAYGLVHGAAPESLDDLVPGFLPGIPAPLNGTDRWEYVRAESNAEHPDVTGFTLSFRSWAHPLYRQERVNGEGQWSMTAE